MAKSETLPPSLAAKPNIPLREQTLIQLHAERAFWQAQIDDADGWGASMGVAAGFRDACDREIARRETKDARSDD